MDRSAFLDQEPPEGYIPGLGRGATGFSVRGEKRNAQVPKRFTNKTTNNKDNQQRLDQQTGDIDDELAETNVFALIDAKRHGSVKEKEKNEKTDIISAEYKFHELKDDLSTVTKREWMDIPEASDFTRRNKRSRLEEQLNRKTYAAPDTLISQNVNLTKLTEEREKILERQLDINFKNKDDADNNEKDEYQNYLNQLELESVNNINKESHAEDMKRMRVILQSYRKSDPKKPEGWIASARLEEKCQKMTIARKLIDEGCQNCPYGEDIWLENIKLHSADSHKCKVLVATAIKFNPASSKLWIKAIDLENENVNKYRVVRKSLQEIPNDETLWKLAVSFETDKSETIRILQKALDFIPKSMDLWAALVKLQDIKEAKSSLNKARKSITNDLKIWILAAELEEKSNPEVSITKLIKMFTKGIKQVIENGVASSLSNWLKQAEILEHNGGNIVNDKSNKKVLQALVDAILIITVEDKMTVNEDDMKLISTLDNSLVKIFSYKKLLEIDPKRLGLWRLLKEVCENLDKIEELFDTFETILFGDSTEIDHTILKNNPKLVLVYVKEIWKYDNNIEKAVHIIDKTLEIVPDSLDVLFAKIKLLGYANLFDKIEVLFIEYFNESKGQKGTDSGLDRLYFKYVNFLRFKSRNDLAIRFLKETCVKQLPGSYKFILQLGEICYSMDDFDNARRWYTTGIERFPKNALFWIQLAKVDEIGYGKTTKARADLDMALVKNANNPESELLLNIAKIQLEKRNNNKDQARLIVSQALKKFPNNARLWVENIELLDTKRSSLKKTMFQDALKYTKNDYLVLLAIGISFYRDSQYSTAIKWIERATKANVAYGDSWVWLCRCQQKLQKDTSVSFKQVKINEPRYGPEWVSISKDPSTQYLDVSEILKRLLDSI